jgi:hypothetical protein
VSTQYELITYFVNKGLVPCHAVTGREVEDFRRIPLEHLKEIGFLMPGPTRSWLARIFSGALRRHFIGVLRFGEQDILFDVYGAQYLRTIMGMVPPIPSITVNLQSDDPRLEWRANDDAYSPHQGFTPWVR